MWSEKERERYNKDRFKDEKNPLNGLLCLKIYVGLGEEKKNKESICVWQHTPLIPTLRKQREADLYGQKTSQVYREVFRPARATR